MDCRQFGAHFPHVAGIAGQSSRGQYFGVEEVILFLGAQSVVLSGGYEDDLDNGEWFLYTGSGGRDLSGNKRTNKVRILMKFCLWKKGPVQIQSFDQKFESYNEALRLSCIHGLPVRVVRSHKVVNLDLFFV